MDSGGKAAKTDPVPDEGVESAKRERRRLFRAAEAFQERAEAAERRWVGGLSIGGKARSR